jgi:hypothetical protein
MENKQITELMSQLANLTNAMEELNTTLDSALGNGKMYYGNVVDGLHEIARSINPERWEVKKK